MSGQGHIVDIMRELLECARQKLIELDPSWDGRVCMNPYSVPTRDDCCKGQLQGTIERYFNSDDFPFDTTGTNPCHAESFAADVIISIYRCFVGVGDRGQPRSCDKLDDATDAVTLEAQAVWRGVVCCLAEMDEVDWVFRSQLPLDNEQPPCIGTDMRLTIGVLGACDCG